MRNLLQTILVLLLSTFANAAYSCSCVKSRGSLTERVTAAAHESEFVGVVRIISVRTAVEMHDANGKYLGFRDPETIFNSSSDIPEHSYLVAAFEVLHAWKGRSMHDIPISDVSTGEGISDCGLPFKVGQTVLLYAYKRDYTGLMGANLCGRSNLLKSALADVRVLNRRYPSRLLNTSKLQAQQEP